MSWLAWFAAETHQDNNTDLGHCAFAKNCWRAQAVEPAHFVAREIRFFRFPRNDFLSQLAPTSQSHPNSQAARWISIGQRRDAQSAKRSFSRISKLLNEECTRAKNVNLANDETPKFRGHVTGLTRDWQWIRCLQEEKDLHRDLLQLFYSCSRPRCARIE